MGNKYEIDVDGDHDMEDHSSNIREEEPRQLKSAVIKKKGRGFSSANASSGLGSVAQFEIIEETSVGRAQKSIEGWSIFVTGLHEECSEEDLFDKFADFGPIKDLKMPLDHRTGYVKGYALIEFATHQEALAAIENMNGQQVMEQNIQCDWAFVQGHSHVSQDGHRQEGRREREVVRRDQRRDERQSSRRNGDGSGREIKVYNDI